MSDVQQPSNPEDVKIIGLARAARARTNAAQGACVRDTDGRTYAATSVALAHLTLSGIAVAVAMAVSSGAEGLEAVALSSVEGPDDSDLAAVRDLPGEGVVVWWTDPAGVVQGLVSVDD
ncbi:MAG: cytidine deaminase [Propionibacteriaceae bacterium]